MDPPPPCDYTPVPARRPAADPASTNPVDAIVTRTRSHTLLVALATACLVLGGPARAAAQGTGAGTGVRLGVVFGGISTLGVSVEYFDDNLGYDLTIGTWSFHDISAAFTVKDYLGASALRPFVGAGLWVVAAAPPQGRTGFAVVAQAPIGADWRVTGRHNLGAVLNVNRGLWVRRTDPDDDLPLNKRLVPLPGAYYRWRSR